MIEFKNACIKILEKENVDTSNISTTEDYYKIYHQFKRLAERQDLITKRGNSILIEFSALDKIVRELKQNNKSMAKTYQKNLDEIKKIFGEHKENGEKSEYVDLFGQNEMDVDATLKKEDEEQEREDIEMSLTLELEKIKKERDELQQQLNEMNDNLELCRNILNNKKLQKSYGNENMIEIVRKIID